MRVFFKWLTRIVLVLAVLIAAAAFWKREEITRLLAVNSLFSEDKIVNNFSHMDAAFLTSRVSRGGGPVSDLPQGAEMTLPASAEAWFTDRAVTSLLVLKNGEIRHESYHLGTKPDDRRVSWSVAKSYLSALMGVVMAEGHITSLDEQVTKYAPTLKGTAYDGATIRNVLNMSSGVEFDEDYFDKNSDINRMGRTVALGGKLDDFTTSLQNKVVEPGEKWIYVSIDTQVISMVIRGATGRSIADLMSEKIVAPLGLDQDGLYITDGDGVAFVLGGLNFTTRDFARFGLMIEQNGEFGGTQVVSSDWVAESTAPSAPTTAEEFGYGYQWWIPLGAHEGEFLARGVYGQYIYIDQLRDVVIVTTAADRNFRAPGTHMSNVGLFREIARGL